MGKTYNKVTLQTISGGSYKKHPIVVASSDPEVFRSLKIRALLFRQDVASVLVDR